jgi:hypothetical protein
MSSKHPKTGGGNPHLDPNQGGGQAQQRQIRGEIHVRGEIEANVPTSFIEQYKVARRENTSRDNWRFCIEMATLAAVLIYAGLTAWQAWETGQAVKTAHEANKLTEESVRARLVINRLSVHQTDSHWAAHGDWIQHQEHRSISSGL